MHKVYRAYRIEIGDVGIPRNNLFYIGLLAILTITLLGLFAPLITDPYETNIDERLKAPSLDHPFGTDQLGRDVFSRVVYGTRTSLIVAVTISIFSMVIGCLVGAISGYFGGVVDDAIGRVIDVFLSIPEIVVNIALVGVFCSVYGSSTWNVIIAVVFTNWVSYARITRGIVLSIREREFIVCSKAVGAGDSWILLRHVIPNVVSPIIVLATLNIGNVILTIASLGFLGLGVQPPTPEWGQILNSGKNYIATAPWITFFSGLFIAGSVFGFNLLGEGLRDALERRNVFD
jgi:peptide/nickel transport system permease protein